MAAFAQTPVFDRPGVAETPFIPKRNTLQLEIGEELFQSRLHAPSWQVPGIMLRTSIADKAEVRLQYGYALFDQLWVENISAKNDPYCFGIKLPLYRNVDSSLHVSFLYQYKDDLKFNEARQFGHDFILTIQKDYGTWSSNLNVGTVQLNTYGLALMTAFCQTWVYSGKWHFFAEPFCYARENAPINPGFDAGALFWPTPSVQLDVSAGCFGYRLEHGFLGLGLSFGLFN